MDALVPFARWLAATDVSHATRALLTQWQWLSPTLQSLHILAVAAIIGAAGAINRRLAGFSGLQRPTASVIRRFAPVIWCALAVNLLTGSFLVVNRPMRYFRNDSFLSKMALILIVCLIVLLVQVSLRRNPAF